MECGGGAWQGRLKKYYPKRSAGVEIFFEPLVYPCKHVFVEQRERLTNTFLPALFFAEHQINVSTAEIQKRISSKNTLADFEDIEEMGDLFNYELRFVLNFRQILNFLK